MPIVPGAGGCITLCTGGKVSPGPDFVSPPSCYKLSGYTDGDLAACSECGTGSGYVWDGRFNIYIGFDEDFNRYIWQPDFVSGYPSFQINGKQTVINAAHGVELYFSTDDCLWHIMIRCTRVDGGGSSAIWLGTKLGGDTPLGDYTRTSGCDTTTTLTVVVC